jgi:hypothetical protein
VYLARKGQLRVNAMFIRKGRVFGSGLARAHQRCAGRAVQFDPHARQANLIMIPRHGDTVKGMRVAWGKNGDPVRCHGLRHSPGPCRQPAAKGISRMR